MLQINYCNDRFEVTFECEDQEDFDEYKNFLKSHYIYYDPIYQVWHYKEERLEEMQILFQREGVEVDYDYDTLNKIKEITDKKKISELKIDRRCLFDPSILNKNIVPFNFQTKVINHHLKLNRVWDCLDAGLGKSFINICAWATLYNLNKVDKAIIIPPIGMSFHWYYEILKFVSLFKEEDFIIIDNKNKKNPFEVYRDKKIMIIPNHILADVLLSYKKSKTNKKSRVRWKSFVNIKEEWDAERMFLLVDESHEFKHSTSLRSKALKSIKDQFYYRNFLTATPFIQKIEHAYNQATMLDKSVIPMSENAFKLWIAEDNGNKWDRYAVNSYNDESVRTLFKKMQSIFIKINKEDIPEMKVKKYMKNVYLKMHPFQQRMYQIIVEEELYKLEEEFEEITLKQIFEKLYLIMYAIDNPFLLKKAIERNIEEKHWRENKELTALFKKWKLSYDNKLLMLDNKLSSYIKDNNEKVIVFCYHPENLDLFYERYQKYNPIIIHGKTEKKDKDRIRTEKRIKFNTDKNCKLALLSLLTSSAGGNWQEQCNRILYYSMHLNATLIRQGVDRTHRIVSKKDSIIEMFNYPYTLDKVRLDMGLNRINLNDKLGKILNKSELKKLLTGISKI